MASLSRIDTGYSTQQAGSISTEQFPLNGLLSDRSTKWTYLIADSIRFNHEVEHAIKLSKPNDDLVFEWIEKLVCGQQCGSIFIENLDTSDNRFQHVKFLCEVYKVILVNLTTLDSLPNNVIVGPWQ